MVDVPLGGFREGGFRGPWSPLTCLQIHAVLYPNLYFLFQDLFGIEIAALKLVNSFGLMVALAFVAASALLRRELSARKTDGVLPTSEITVWVG